MSNTYYQNVRVPSTNISLRVLWIGVFCILFSVPAYAGLGVSVAGTPTDDWAIGNIRSEDVSTTATNRWTLTNTGNVPASIYIKVAGTNWSPASSPGADTFVLKYCASGSSSYSSAITSSGDGIWFTLLGNSTSTTKDFGLRFEAPTSASTHTSDTMTVTLTAKYFYVADGEFDTLLAGELVCVGTATGYLMWAYDKDGAGAGPTRQWKDESTDGGPEWNSTTFVYDYTAGGCATHCEKAYYPAFSWAEDLDWQGYTDWRLPTKEELAQLYNLGRTYITYYSSRYWSGTEYSATYAYYVNFAIGGVNNYHKTNSYYVRAVRSGQW